VPSRLLLAEHAWLGGELGMAAGVLIGVEGGRIASVETGINELPPGASRLGGVTLPGLVNAHSHAFHRALRGRSEAGTGDFWTWREMMYGIAGALTPESYLELATAVYAEMALSGITAVGEFHYLHHGPDGTPYSDPNAMGLALVAASRRAGVRLTLIDTCYLQGGLDGRALEGGQRRFGDAGPEAWAARVELLLGEAPAAGGEQVRVGVAAHSVRALDRGGLRTVAAFAARHRLPLHVHLSEQRRENEECLSLHGCTPTTLLSEEGVLTPHTTAVHATHLAPHDITLLGSDEVAVCACPTTERDLADGVGPFSDLRDAGSPLCIGTDSQAVIDPFEEMRGIELNERLVTNRRGLHRASALLDAGSRAGSHAIGWPEGGRIAVGAPADLVTLDVGSVRLAGAQLRLRDGTTAGATSMLAEQVVFAATGADVRQVIVGGRTIVEDGHHVDVPDAAGALTRALASLFGTAPPAPPAQLRERAPL
jgi:formiminoglutamate deiminase